MVKEIFLIRQSWQKQLQIARSIAVIRADSFNQGLAMAKAVSAGGMSLIEITWNSDRALELVNRLRQELPDCTIGMGTIVSTAALGEAIAAGAEFLFSPHTDRNLIDAAIDRAVPIIPGALTPTEILTAWQAGAASVKVFPIQAVGGASYIRAIQAPLGDLPLIPTGGVTPDNAASFLAAGAIAVGLSGQLFPSGAIAGGNWAEITRRAEGLMERVKSFQLDDRH
ncbi:MAG: bifunctional 4-hydroxy-2-oxoglutarate aldolase/2-dehydro-3-deoxy-phosphogluconate aldolase [Leptolyngbyaceae cyanobacterium SM1_3_5]|nr:bifunctional 4-hydroxy-2-oxoglutarate aldolase/2-dehydro-3-deoxy-phosphogluconate aldolase [Leptolyngbyaceae cyanobacterium SM1_3_5]